MFFRNINLFLLKKSSSCYFQASISIWPSSTSVPPTEMEILLWFSVLNSLLSWSDSAYSKSLSTWVRIILTINALFFGPPSFFFFFPPCPWGLQNYRKKKNPSDVNATFSLQNSNAKRNLPTEKFGSANYLPFSFWVFKLWFQDKWVFHN